MTKLLVNFVLCILNYFPMFVIYFTGFFTYFIAVYNFLACVYDIFCHCEFFVTVFVTYLTGDCNSLYRCLYLILPLFANIFTGGSDLLYRGWRISVPSVSYDFLPMCVLFYRCLFAYVCNLHCS